MRTKLKQHTAAAHQRVDQAVSTLSLAHRASYITFLRTHQLAYRALLPALPADNWVSSILRRVLTTLNQDLDIMDVPGLPRPMIGLRDPIHPLGVAYVVCGSHFGKRILRRRWSLSRDPQVRAAGAYLSCDELKAGWLRFLHDIEALTDPANDLKLLAADADRTFGLFYDSLVAAKNGDRANAA